jgi:hypothetical protein
LVLVSEFTQKNFGSDAFCYDEERGVEFESLFCVVVFVFSCFFCSCSREKGWSTWKVERGGVLYRKRRRYESKSRLMVPHTPRCRAGKGARRDVGWVGGEHVPRSESRRSAVLGGVLILLLAEEGLEKGWVENICLGKADVVLGSRRELGGVDAIREIGGAELDGGRGNVDSLDFERKRGGEEGVQEQRDAAGAGA